MKIVIRTDSSINIGTGHVMRCLALGQGIKDNGGNVVFITYCESEGLIDRLKKEDFCIHKLQAPGSLEKSLQIMSDEKPDWVVLDGYHFDTEFKKAVKDAGYRLLYIDDYAHLAHYYADIILNQNYGAEKFHYNAEPHTKILAGTEYVLLRREFRYYAAFKRNIPVVAHKVLITLGGADPENYTLKVMKAVNLVRVPLEIKVIIGAGNPHYESIRGEAHISMHKVEILRAVENMAPLMAWADIAISAGGTTVWELAFMGLPSVLCIVADNQENAVNSLVHDRVFVSVGRLTDKRPTEIADAVSALSVNREEREAMAASAQSAVDGWGVIRIIDTLEPRPLNILFLGGNQFRELAEWIQARGDKVRYIEERIDTEFVKKMSPDIIISYNYRHLLKEDVLRIPPRRAVNLHISYLPWNRGADPNPWSFLDGTPKGVTIHNIDEGIDTGDILFQKEVVIDENTETLKSSYALLHEEIKRLFMENWELIRSRGVSPRKQQGEGSIHYMKDRAFWEPFLGEKGWDTPIREFNARIRRGDVSHV